MSGCQVPAAKGLGFTSELRLPELGCGPGVEDYLTCPTRKTVHANNGSIS